MVPFTFSQSGTIPVSIVSMFNRSDSAIRSDAYVDLTANFLSCCGQNVNANVSISSPFRCRSGWGGIGSFF